MRSSFFQRLVCACVPLMIIAGKLGAITIPYADNFNDNTTGPEWQIVEDAPTQLFLSETAGTLQINAPGSTSPTNDALYISNGLNRFRLLTNADFQISIDYSFQNFQSSTDGSKFGLVFGIGKDLPDGTDSAAIGYGYADIGPATVGSASTQYRNNDIPSTLVAVGGSNSGTFVISYATATDRLTLGVLGFSSTNYDGLVQGLWNASDVYVSFGGRGSGFVTSGSDARFDNFQVISGQAIPEPATGFLVSAGLAIVAVCSRHFVKSRKTPFQSAGGD